MKTLYVTRLTSYIGYIVCNQSVTYKETKWLESCFRYSTLQDRKRGYDKSYVRTLWWKISRVGEKKQTTNNKQAQFETGICQCQLLNIALVCKYVAHMGHWPSGFSKINLLNLLVTLLRNHGYQLLLYSVGARASTKLASIYVLFFFYKRIQ